MCRKNASQINARRFVTDKYRGESKIYPLNVKQLVNYTLINSLDNSSAVNSSLTYLSNNAK